VDQVPETVEISGRDVVERLALRDKLRVRLLRRMEHTQVLLMPVCSVPAFRPRQREWEIDGRRIDLREMISCVTPFNLFGLPAVTIPFGKTEEGLPVGIQLVGAPYSEELLLEIAVRLEQCRGDFGGPAGY
jgi:Asp-tRNA(Asn)/Glu-tRNA(Gln) amidotransferase A subunit family amidase